MTSVNDLLKRLITLGEECDFLKYTLHHLYYIHELRNNVWFYELDAKIGVYDYGWPLFYPVFDLTMDALTEARKRLGWCKDLIRQVKSKQTKENIGDIVKKLSRHFSDIRELLDDCNTIVITLERLLSQRLEGEFQPPVSLPQFSVSNIPSANKLFSVAGITADYYMKLVGAKYKTIHKPMIVFGSHEKAITCYLKQRLVLLPYMPRYRGRFFTDLAHEVGHIKLRDLLREIRAEIWHITPSEKLKIGTDQYVDALRDHLTQYLKETEMYAIACIKHLVYFKEVIERNRQYGLALYVALLEDILDLVYEFLLLLGPEETERIRNMVGKNRNEPLTWRHLKIILNEAAVEYGVDLTSQIIEIMLKKKIPRKKLYNVLKIIVGEDIEEFASYLWVIGILLDPIRTKEGPEILNRIIRNVVRLRDTESEKELILRLIWIKSAVETQISLLKAPLQERIREFSDNFGNIVREKPQMREVVENLLWILVEVCKDLPDDDVHGIVEYIKNRPFWDRFNSFIETMQKYRSKEKNIDECIEKIIEKKRDKYASSLDKINNYLFLAEKPEDLERWKEETDKKINLFRGAIVEGIEAYYEKKALEGDKNKTQEKNKKDTGDEANRYLYGLQLTDEDKKIEEHLTELFANYFGACINLDAEQHAQTASNVEIPDVESTEKDFLHHILERRWQFNAFVEKYYRKFFDSLVETFREKTFEGTAGIYSCDVLLTRKKMLEDKWLTAALEHTPLPIYCSDTAQLNKLKKQIKATATGRFDAITYEENKQIELVLFKEQPIDKLWYCFWMLHLKKVDEVAEKVETLAPFAMYLQIPKAMINVVLSVWRAWKSLWWQRLADMKEL